jgi:glycosyltransferase involved in cell wall biosynthesis
VKVHWFSPLPPAKTGIADYTSRLLPALSKRVDLTLWTDQETWDHRLEDSAEVRQYQPAHMPWSELNRGHVSIYHIGNNPLFHGGIWQVSRRHPGIVVLHDLCLQNFFAGVYRDLWNDRDGYVHAMTRYYGQRGQQDADAFWDGHLTVEYLREHYPLTGLAVDKALGIVVHSQEELEDIVQAGSRPIIRRPLPYASVPSARPQGETSHHDRVLKPPYRLIVFGFIHINRRLESLLQALATMPERQQFSLQVYGELWDEELVRSQIRFLGLDDVVTMHGFVSEAELQAALSDAHLAVNLRYPTMGEASISQLQIWEHGLPTLVTAAGWYASFPPDSVAFVRPTHEIEDIQAHLQGFLVDPDRFACMGAQGRRILEERHHPGAYVEALIELADEAIECRAVAAWQQLLHHVQAEVNTWTAPFALQNAVLGWLSEVDAQRHKRVPLTRLKSLGRHHVATFLALEDAIATQRARLGQLQEAALSAISRAVAEQVGRGTHENDARWNGVFGDGHVSGV